MSISKFLAWLAAVAAVLIFYAGFLTGQPSSETTPPLTAVVLAALALRALLGIHTLQLAPARDLPRMASTVLMALALLGFLVSATYGYLTRPSALPDWGLFALQLGLPVILILTIERGDLIRAICKVCVIFASIDMIANLLAVAGLFELPQLSARVDQFGRSLRYPGLSGNTHAGGLVAFIAMVYLINLFDFRRLFSSRNVVLAAWTGLIFISLLFIDARRYLVLIICAAPLLAIPFAKRIPLPALMTVVVALMLGRTFTADFSDRGNQLRQDLMMSGAARAAEHPWLGEGVFYRSGEGLISTFSSLSQAGVTESMVLDFSISYGIFSTLAFVAACVLAAGGRRASPHPPAIFLALLTAELFFGGVLQGVLGSVLFFACLTYCQREQVGALGVAALPQLSARPAGKAITAA